MTIEISTALVSSADRLARVRPAGQVSLAPELLALLYRRIEQAGSEDPAIPAAVAEGDAAAAAIAAGCPPQFHPGVPPDHAAVLLALRTALGLDRATAVVLAPDTDGRHVRILRAIGCTLITDHGNRP